MEFNLNLKSWKNLTEIQHGIPPSPRACHGLASASGKIYVHGGIDEKGDFFHKNVKYVIFVFVPLTKKETY